MAPWQPLLPSGTLPCRAGIWGVLLQLPHPPVGTVALEHWPSGRTRFCRMCYFKGAGGSLWRQESGEGANVASGGCGAAWWAAWSEGFQALLTSQASSVKGTCLTLSFNTPQLKPWSIQVGFLDALSDFWGLQLENCHRFVTNELVVGNRDS